MTRSSAAKSVHTSSGNAGRVSSMRICSTMAARTPAACSSWGFSCAAASLLLASMQTQTICARSHRGITDWRLLIVRRGPAPSIRTFTMSFRLRRICRLRKGQGKRELRIFLPRPRTVVSILLSHRVRCWWPEKGWRQLHVPRKEHARSSSQPGPNNTKVPQQGQWAQPPPGSLVLSSPV